MSIQGLVGHLALLLFLLPACGDSGAGANCDPDPPCDLGGSIEIPVNVVFGPLSYDVTLETDLGSVAFACELSDTEGSCTQTDRTGLEGWAVELTAVVPGDTTRTLVLDIDRGEDETPGPHSLSLELRSSYEYRVKSFGRQRKIVSTNGQTCEECWYELPDSV